MNPDHKILGALFLHFGTDQYVQLTDFYCVSASSDNGCYDPDYNGPWPNVFFDEEFVIDFP